MFDFIGSAVGAIGSGVLGGVLGVVGSFLQKREERKTLELSNSHELSLAQIDLEESKLERTHALDMADKKIEEAQVEGEIALDLADADSFSESMKSQSVSSGNKIVDSIRSLMRPTITLYLLAISTMLYFSLSDSVGGLKGLPIDEVFKLYKSIINDILFLTVTSVTWWFASRTKNRK